MIRKRGEGREAGRETKRRAPYFSTTNFSEHSRKILRNFLFFVIDQSEAAMFCDTNLHFNKLALH